LAAFERRTSGETGAEEKVCQFGAEVELGARKKKKKKKKETVG